MRREPVRMAARRESGGRVHVRPAVPSSRSGGLARVRTVAATASMHSERRLRQSRWLPHLALSVSPICAGAPIWQTWTRSAPKRTTPNMCDHTFHVSLCTACARARARVGGAAHCVCHWSKTYGFSSPDIADACRLLTVGLQERPTENNETSSSDSVSLITRILFPSSGRRIE